MLPMPSDGGSLSAAAERGRIKVMGERNRSSAYVKCFVIVLIWIAIGTLFYSHHNQWPLPQSFFYAVDAGMSIGFCTDVRETLVSSRAFTIVYILLGASVVGGALALFIEDTMEGVLAASTRGYKRLVVENAFQRADTDRDGLLSHAQFRRLFRCLDIDEATFARVCTCLDPAASGHVTMESVARAYPQLDELIAQCRASGAVDTSHGATKLLWRLRGRVRRLAGWARDNRVYLTFGAWIGMGIAWGCLDQGWDIITATHFAVSALATGGLTAPPVNAAGILPADDAIFVGIFCLFGIPLFALTLSKAARILVQVSVILPLPALMYHHARR